MQRNLRFLRLILSINAWCFWKLWALTRIIMSPREYKKFQNRNFRCNELMVRKQVWKKQLAFTLWWINKKDWTRKREMFPPLCESLEREFENLYNIGRSECFFDIRTKEMCAFHLPSSLSLPSTGNNYETIRWLIFFRERHEKAFAVQQEECIVIRSIAHWCCGYSAMIFIYLHCGIFLDNAVYYNRISFVLLKWWGVNHLNLTYILNMYVLMYTLNS